MSATTTKPSSQLVELAEFIRNWPRDVAQLPEFYREAGMRMLALRPKGAPRFRYKRGIVPRLIKRLGDYSPSDYTIYRMLRMAEYFPRQANLKFFRKREVKLWQIFAVLRALGRGCKGVSSSADPE